MARRLSGAAIRYLGLFEETTGVEAADCLIDDEYERLVFVVPVGDLASAIGPGGETVKRLERQVDREVILIEDAVHPDDFVANALRPAAVYDVTIEDGVATVKVAEGDIGTAIGRDGRTIELARLLAKRHFELSDIELV